MTALPEFVYLITVDTEWPVSAIAGDNHAASLIEDEVRRREESANISRPDQVHIWRIPVTDAVELELRKSHMVPASLGLKLSGGGS